MPSPDLKEVVASALRIDPEAVTDDLGFGKTREWDSMNHVALMMALEAEYGVAISDDQVVELTDVRAIAAFLAAEAAARPAE